MARQIRVVGAVVVKDNRVLCAQRGFDGSLPGLWEFPGGKIEPGESPAEALAREIAEIKRLLEIDPKRNTYRLVTDIVVRDPEVISITTRSLMSIMFYLSHNVETPKEHLEKGWTKVTHDHEGHSYDWQQTPAGRIFRIQTSSSRPDDAFISIPYNDNWFYIPQKDLESKSTFMLLTQLFRLQAGSAKSVTPALTIPVR